MKRFLPVSLLLAPLLMTACSRAGRIGVVLPKDTGDIGAATLDQARGGDANAQYELGLLQLSAKDPAERQVAIRLVEQAAMQGKIEAQAKLGAVLLAGDGVPQDYAKAVEWLKKAVAQGSDVGQYALGIAYHDGKGVLRNFSQSIKLWKDSALQGYAPAQTKLGQAYELGEGVTADPVRAAEWYQKAADRSDVAGQYHLGLLYEQGIGVPKDRAKALEWFSKAAALGYKPAQQKVPTAGSSAPAKKPKAAKKVTPQ